MLDRFSFNGSLCSSTGVGKKAVQKGVDLHLATNHIFTPLAIGSSGIYMGPMSENFVSELGHSLAKVLEIRTLSMHYLLQEHALQRDKSVSILSPSVLVQIDAVFLV